MTAAVIFKAEGLLTGWCVFRAQSRLSPASTPTPLGGLHPSEESAQKHARHHRTITTVDIATCADGQLAAVCRRVGALAEAEALAAITAALTGWNRSYEIALRAERTTEAAAEKARRSSADSNRLYEQAENCEAAMLHHQHATHVWANHTQSLIDQWQAPQSLLE